MHSLKLLFTIQLTTKVIDILPYMEYICYIGCVESPENTGKLIENTGKLIENTGKHSIKHRYTTKKRSKL